MNPNRIDWDTHHMLLAQVTAMRSPDPNTQVGCCIVNTDEVVIALGYNGTPKNIDPESISWDRHGTDPLNTKYPYIVHAEANAIYNLTTSAKGATMYCTLFPCNECMKAIIQAGIREVNYMEDKYVDTWQVKASKEMADQAGVRYYHLDCDRIKL